MEAHPVEVFPMHQLRYVLPIAGILFHQATQAQELLAQAFHPNGKLSATLYSDGDAQRYLSYYSSGRIREMGSFRAGGPDGQWEQFAENGTLIAVGLFEDGARQGTWEFRDENGRLLGRLVYADGKLISGKRYDSAGAEVESRTF